MVFLGAVETDVGNVKATNQDSACILVAQTPTGQIAMALICDGMGGLEKGELASATVIRTFQDWFCRELPQQMAGFGWDAVQTAWMHQIKVLNRTISDYGKFYGFSLGTTVTAMLLYQDTYLIAHVGDSRAYMLQSDILQLTEDHSVVGREVRRGTLTAQQAEQDPRRNVLLQCVGASKTVSPQILQGQIRPGAHYLLCSDGFRHVITPEELLTQLGPAAVRDPGQMHTRLRGLIDLAMSRGERDNISALLIRAEG
mgnify:FL=1